MPTSYMTSLRCFVDLIFIIFFVVGVLFLFHLLKSRNQNRVTLSIMLPQSHRLPASDIPRIMKHGTRITGNGIVLITANNETDVSRFSFIVSTKIDKRATVRNRIKRLLSESVRLLLPTITKHIDCIMIARHELMGLNQKEVGKRVMEVLKRAS